MLLLTTMSSAGWSLAASATSSPPRPPQCPVRGAGGSLIEASAGWRADELSSNPGEELDHSDQLRAPLASDFLAAGSRGRRDVRFDCSHWQHRVVVASPWRSTLSD